MGFLTVLSGQVGFSDFEINETSGILISSGKFEDMHCLTMD